MLDILINSQEFQSDISFEPREAGQSLKEWVQTNYSDEEIRYLIVRYAQNIVKNL